jgi:hypothetical protein
VNWFTTARDRHDSLEKVDDYKYHQMGLVDTDKRLEALRQFRYNRCNRYG